MPIRKCLSVFLLFLVAAPLSGQTIGAVLGRVTDPSGAVVPSAKVEIVSEQTALSTATTAGPQGDYTLPHVEPGLYRVNVSAAGFKTRVVRNVSVSVNQTVRLDVALEVGDVATEVEVRATAPVVESDRSSVGSVVDGRQIEAMPLNGRTDIFTLLALAPGVQRSPFSANPLIGGGTHFGSTNMTVDGVTNNDVGNERLLGPLPSLDAVAEFKVISSGASAEFGRGGAQVIVATKSGTNELHGSLFAFNRTGDLSAKNFFATHLPRPPFSRNEFGATLGGPIMRNKLFFFVGYEGLRRRVTATSVTAMPTPALKAGDFSGLPPIRDPFTGAPFPGNQIPAGRISPVARELLNFASDPNTPTTAPAGLGNNFTTNVPTNENMDRFSARIDYQATAADHVSGRFFAVENGPFVSFLGGGTDRFGNWGGFGVATRNAMGEYTRILSSSMLNQFRVGFTREQNFRTPQNPDFDPSRLVPGLISPLAGLGGLPTVTITGFRGFSDAPGSGDIKRSYEIIERLTWTNNRHSVKAGFEWQRANAFNFQNPPPVRGSFTFDGRYSGHPFADFLLGTAAATGRVSRNAEAEPVNQRYAAYIQDDWVVTPRLTLNLGLRYEYASLFKNARRDLANFYPELGQVVVLDGQADPRLMAALPIVEGASVGLGPDNYMNKDRNNFGPRVGFAFRPLGTTRLVARGSYGIFYNVIPAYVGPFNLTLNPPFRVAETFEPAPGPVPSLTFANPFPGQGTIPTSPGLSAVARDRRNPYHQQWNLTLEYELRANTAVRVSYVGNRGVHLERQFNLNDPPPAPGPVQPRRPFQPFGPITYFESGRDSITHQLQLGAIRRFASGLAFQFEYQWTKALGEQVFGLPPMDNRNPRLDRGNLDFIRRHWVALNYIYELPFGRGKRFGNSLSGAADKIVGGWQIAGLASFGTGQPFSVTYTSRTLGWPSGRADIVGDPDPADRSIDRWFDPTAFAVPAPFTYGNSARNMLFGPAFFNWDAALFKRTPINDRFTLEFRAEFFNILNHPSFGLPAADITTPATVGRITSTANEPRNIQFGVRLSF
jgi:outer membrane receptor protein involved in Fe transport